MADYDLDRLLVQIRRIEEHREKGAEAEIRKTYQALLQDLRHYLADEYTRYAEDDHLTYEILQRHGAYARFLEEVEQKINDISPEIRRSIRSTVEQTYEYTYNGMVESVKKVVMNPAIAAGLKACTPDVIRRAVENPVSKLTLNDRLEKHRKEIVYDIKQNITVGLMNGDRYTTMANRIKQSVDGDYKKAIRIARTETHRVREAGNHDAAVSVNGALKDSTTGLQMVKTWRTMKDERVRPAKAKGRNRQYNHRKMDGVTVPVDEEFVLPSGAKTKAPGQSGVAGEDINCRCYLSYGLQKQPVGLSAGENAGIVPDHPGPELLESLDFSDEKLVQSKLAEYEAQIVSQPTENAIVITKAGKVYRCTGDLNGVYPDADLGEQLIGAVMTHNHPAGSTNEYSFSSADLSLYMDYKLKCLRGVDEHFIYEFTRDTSELDEHISLFDMTDFDSRHEQVIDMAKRYGIGYRRWKRG